MRRSRVEIPAKSGTEHDVFSPWRNILCFTQRPGVCKGVKKQYHKRVRREVRRIIENAVQG